MSYTIIRSDGNVLTTIADNIIDSTTTSISLPGRNYSGYGQPVDTTWVRMLENFAAATVPQNPIRGQLWFNVANTSNPTMKICPTDGETNSLAWLNLISTDINGNVQLDAGNINVPNGNVFANNLNSNDIVQCNRAFVIGVQESTSTTTGALVISGGVGIAKNLRVGGNLWVEGDITYINVTDLYVEDPIITQGGGPNGAPLTTNDGKDRGQLLQYYSGSPKSAFMGWDNSGAEFILGSDVTIASDIVTVTTYGNLRLGNLALVGGFTTAGNIVTTAVTPATSTTTGALQVAGGAGIAGNLYVGGNIRGTDTTGATSTTTGAMVTAGGAGVAGNLYVGGNVVGTDTTAATSTTSGALRTAGGAGVAGNLYVGGNVVGTDTTAATSTTSGALRTAGGAGIAGNLYVGGNIRGTDTTDATSTTTGAATTAGGMGIAKNLYVGGNIRGTDTTDATSTTTGSFVLAGGAGIAGNLFVGGNLNFTGNLKAPGADTQVLFNDTGNIAGDAGLLYDKTNQVIAVNAALDSTIGANIGGDVKATSYHIGGNDHLLYDVNATTIGFRISTGGPYFTVRDLGVSSIDLRNASGGTVGISSAAKSLVLDQVNNLTTLNTNFLTTGYVQTTALTTGAAATAGTLTGDLTLSAGSNIKGTNTQFRISGGTAGDFLQTDGAGGLSWAVLSANAISGGGRGMWTANGAISGAWTLNAGASLQATYADLAERHHADRQYPVGTVMRVGGVNEITQTDVTDADNVLGVISNTAAYLMNATAGSDDTHPAVCAVGRIPVRVVGPIGKGQKVTTAANGCATASFSGQGFGWALETNTAAEEKLVLCVIK